MKIIDQQARWERKRIRSFVARIRSLSLAMRLNVAFLVVHHSKLEAGIRVRRGSSQDENQVVSDTALLPAMPEIAARG